MRVLSTGDDAPRDEVDRWRALVDHLPALVAYWDRDLHNVVANAAYLRWFGLRPDQVRGMHIEDVLGATVYRANLPYIRGALAGEHQHFDRTLVTTAGETRHTQAEYIPHLTDAGVQGFYVLVTDVTERVEARRELLATQALARRGSFTFEPATERLWFSPELLQLLGFDPLAPAPTLERYLEIVHPDDRDDVAAVRALAALGEEYETSYRILSPDGTPRHVHSRTSQVLGPDGTVLLLRGVMQDETELQRLADELADSNRLLTDLITMLGHDLAGPIAVSNGYLEHLEEEWDEQDRATRRILLRRAARASRRVGHVLHDILSIVDVESAELTTRPEAVDVTALITEATQDATVDVTVACRTRSRAWVDPVHLGRVVDNLLSNAGRYGRPPFSVCVDEDDGEVVVAVHDHGDGVPPEFVPHLFDRFSRASTGPTAAVEGSGFGLYLVRRLALANHGAVAYRVPPDGPGAVFELRLPVAPRCDACDMQTAPDLHLCRSGTDDRSG